MWCTQKHYRDSGTNTAVILLRQIFKEHIKKLRTPETPLSYHYEVRYFY